MGVMQEPVTSPAGAPGGGRQPQASVRAPHPTLSRRERGQIFSLKGRFIKPLSPAHKMRNASVAWEGQTGFEGEDRAKRGLGSRSSGLGPPTDTGVASRGFYLASVVQRRWSAASVPAARSGSPSISWRG